MKDTLDVWFDSGTTHRTVLRGSHAAESTYPADLYLEGSDQHRGWFHSSLLTGAAIDGRAPYKALLTHGFVVDGKGMKMSKSKGNVVAPQKISDTLGAEILRLWVASTDYSGELSIDEKTILPRVVEVYRRLRNTLRFLLANTADFDAKTQMLPPAEWLEVDRYALALTRKLQDQCTADYERFEFHKVVQALMNFCSEDLGAFYLDILKDRLYTAAENSRARRSAQSALWHILQAVTRLMAPVLSFTAEEIWTTLQKQGDSVMLATWHVLPEQAEESALATRWQAIRAVRADVTQGARRTALGRQDRFLAAGRSHLAGRRRHPRSACPARRRPQVRPDLLEGDAGKSRRRRHGDIGDTKHPRQVRALLALARGRRAGCGTSRTLRTLHLEPVRRRRGTRDCLGWHAGWGWLHWWCCSTRPARPGCWRAFATWKAW
jgi:isoleucyl-tRNA synthetase